MRLFTSDEKRLLERINDGTGRNLYNLIDDWIAGVSFQIDRDADSIKFIFENAPLVEINNRRLEIQRIVIQIVNLIKLFEEKGYIFTFVNYTNFPEGSIVFGQAAINVPTVTYQFPDPRISKLFIDYSMKEIFVTPELGKFIQDGFITREELRANRQFRITRNALIVAIIALIINIMFNLSNWRRTTSVDVHNTPNCINQGIDFNDINKTIENE